MERDAMRAARVRAFVEQDYGRVVAAVHAVTHCDEPEDAVQDALVQVLSRDDAVDNLRAWVTTVAINKVRDAQRHQQVVDRTAPRLTSRHGADVEATAATRADVLRAIDDLPRRQRQIVLLHYYLDAPVSAIAASLGVSEGTVKTQLHRGRAVLAKELGGEA